MDEGKSDISVNKTAIFAGFEFEEETIGKREPLKYNCSLFKEHVNVSNVPHNLIEYIPASPKSAAAGTSAAQEPSEPLTAWYQRQAPEGAVTWTAALEGWELKPVALTDSDPDDAEQDSFTSGRATSAEAFAQRSVEDP